MKKKIILIVLAVIVIMVGIGFYIAESYGWINLSAASRYKRSYRQSDNSQCSFTDVDTNTPGRAEIIAVCKKGYMVGYGDGTFRPYQDATRAMALVANMRAHKDSLENIRCVSKSDWPYEDVSCNHWAYDYIANAKKKGYLDDMYAGDPNSFGPDDWAVRSEILPFFYRVRNVGVPNYQSTCDMGNSDSWPFLDTPCTTGYFNEIFEAKKENIIQGYGNGEFMPENIATRADLAVVIYRSWIDFNF